MSRRSAGTVLRGKESRTADIGQIIAAYSNALGNGGRGLSGCYFSDRSQRDINLILIVDQARRQANIGDLIGRC